MIYLPKLNDKIYYMNYRRFDNLFYDHIGTIQVKSGIVLKGKIRELKVQETNPGRVTVNVLP
jgi:hypothetical protein